MHVFLVVQWYTRVKIMSLQFNRIVRPTLFTLVNNIEQYLVEPVSGVTI